MDEYTYRKEVKKIVEQAKKLQAKYCPNVPVGIILQDAITLSR